MLKIILIATAAALALSCKKDSELQRFQKKISGTWELEKSTGLISLNYPPGNGRIIVIKDNGGYERKQHDTLVFSGAYSLSAKTDCYPRTDNTLMQTTDGGGSFYVNVENEKLVLSSSNCIADGGGGTYRRVQ